MKKNFLAISESILAFLVYSNLLISFAAVVLFELCMQVLAIKVFWINHICIFLSSFLTYNSSIFYLKNPCSPKFVFMWQHIFWFKIAFGIALAALFCCFWFLKPQQLLFLGHLAAISVFYTIPFYKKKSLRNLPYLKVLLVGYVWAAMSVFLLADLNTKTMLLFLGQFCFIVGITLIFDIRDIQTDQKSQLKTFVQTFGIAQTKLLAYLFLFFSSVFFFKMGLYGLLINNLLALVLVFLATPQRHELYFTGLVDSLIFGQYIFSLLW